MPEQVADEITRVTKLGAFVYSEIPFLQCVHEGAYDFTRYTLSGHRRLFSYFHDVDSGVVAGPGTVLAWSIDHLSQCLFRNRRISKAIRIFARFCFLWVKYIDYLIMKHPKFGDGASATYFYGTRKTDKTPPSEIIERYARK